MTDFRYLFDSLRIQLYSVIFKKQPIACSPASSEELSAPLDAGMEPWRLRLALQLSYCESHPIGCELGVMRTDERRICNGRVEAARLYLVLFV